MVLKLSKIKILMVLMVCFYMIIFLFTSFSLADPYKIEFPSDQQIKILKVLLNKDVTIKQSAAVKSQHHKKAYYVGLKFTIEGIREPQIGIWIVSGSKDRPGFVLAVDGFGKEFRNAVYETGEGQQQQDETETDPGGRQYAQGDFFRKSDGDGTDNLERLHRNGELEIETGGYIEKADG